MLHYNLVALVEIILANISLKEALFEEDISKGEPSLKVYLFLLMSMQKSPFKLEYQPVF